MYQSTYYLEKSSNTFADNLAAFGLAFVLNGLANHRAEVRLQDVGPAYAVICEPGLREEWVQSCEFFSGAPFLITLDNNEKSKTFQQKLVKGTQLAYSALPPEGEVVADYESAKQNNARFFEWMKSLPPEGRRQAARGELHSPTSPHPDWDLFRAINPAGLQTYNALLAEWWQGQDVFPDLVRALLRMTATLPNDVAGAEKAWAEICKENGWEKPKAASASQLFNPAQGKGTNYAKTVWSAPGNLKSFWLLEFLKLVGLRYGGFTRLVRGTKDRKTYALIPTRLGWSDHRIVMDKFRRAMSGSDSAVRMDIFASLRYTQALLEHLEEAQLEDAGADLFGVPASDYVKGFEMAFYKSLGNSAATMNIASINLPGWVYLKSAESLTALKEALNEHILVVRSLDESRGDQFELLTLYRDFLSANDLTPFFAFTTAYSGFIIHQRERHAYAKQFTTTNLEVLIMNVQPNYTEIIQANGFREVAYAIRQATVTAQYRKANKDKFQVFYDVRYGLGQQLGRKANYPNDFLAELALFLQKYNAETSQMYENLTSRHKGNIPEGVRRQMRRRVETTALDDILILLHKFGNDSKLICNLLIAYGYAREPYDRQEADQQTEELIEVDDNLGETSSDED